MDSTTKMVPMQRLLIRMRGCGTLLVSLAALGIGRMVLLFFFLVISLRLYWLLLGSYETWSNAKQRLNTQTHALLPPPSPHTHHSIFYEHSSVSFTVSSNHARGHSEAVAEVCRSRGGMWDRDPCNEEPL